MWKGFPKVVSLTFVPYSRRELPYQWFTIIDVSWLGKANPLLGLLFSFLLFLPQTRLLWSAPPNFPVMDFSTFRLAQSVDKSFLCLVLRNSLQIFVSVAKVIFWFAFCLPFNKFRTCARKRGVFCISHDETSNLEFDFAEPWSSGLIS